MVTNVHQNLVLLEHVAVEKKSYQHRKDSIVASLKTLLVQKMLERKLNVLKEGNCALMNLVWDNVQNL